MAVDWDVSMDEAGLARVLAQMEEQRDLGNEAELGHGYLALARLSKWVRIDAERASIFRSGGYADQALQIFLRLGDRLGEARALRVIGDPFNTKSQTRNVNRALDICRDIGDELEIARCLVRQGQILGMTNKAQAIEKNREALAMFERLDDPSGQARCWFSLAIQLDDDAEIYQACLLAATLFRRVGNLVEAARSAAIADMYCRNHVDPSEFRPIIQQGLEDAQAAGDRSLEQSMYGALARIASEMGESGQAETYQRWADDLQNADGLTPKERLEIDLGMTEMMLEGAFKGESQEQIELWTNGVAETKRKLAELENSPE